MNAIDMSQSSELSVKYIRTSVLELYCTDEQIQSLIDRVNAGESRVDVLLSINRSDAVRVLCGLAPRSVLIEVSAACANRAKEYAADYAAAAARNTAYGANAAAYADYAAAYAANAADYADYAAEPYTAELGTTIRHFCMLMGWN